MIVLKVWLNFKKNGVKNLYMHPPVQFMVYRSPNVVETDELKPITDYNKYKV